MSESILTSTKKILGIAEEYTVFDTDIIMHINTALGVVAQLGIGPSQGLAIADATTTWSRLTYNNNILNMVKTYVYLRVRNLFDPPQTSFLLKAQEEQMRELEWRLSAYRESVDWYEPGTEPVEYVYDGGTASSDVEEVVLDGGAP